jgi:hypothetical protein
MNVFPQATYRNEGFILSRDPMDSSPGLMKDDLIKDTRINDENDYEFYKRRHDAAIGLATVGIALSAVGFGISMARLARVDDIGLESVEYDFPTGFVLFNIGMPIFISMAIISANNGKAMRKIERNTNLSLGMSQYGIGLRLRL